MGCNIFKQLLHNILIYCHINDLALFLVGCNLYKIPQNEFALNDKNNVNLKIMKYFNPFQMKPVVSIVFGLMVLFCYIPGFCQDIADNRGNPDNSFTGDTLLIVSSPELSNLAIAWTREYGRLNPSVNFSVRNIMGKEIIKTRGIYFISNEYTGVLNDDSAWKISIGHDAIVPVISAKNPMLGEISDQGISSNEFTKLLSGKEKLNWSEVISGGQNKPVNPYFLDNTEIITGVSGYTLTDQVTLNANLSEKAEDFIAAIQVDPYAIGFCKLSDIRREDMNELVADIRLLPIDKNGNGRIDNFENIYNTPDDLLRGVWIGKYPHALSGSIYAMSQTKPTEASAIAFLEWIMNEGGKYLASSGYSELISLEKQSNLASLANNPANEETRPQTGASLAWLVILAAVVATGIILMMVFWVYASIKPLAAKEVITLKPFLNANIVSGPEGLYYDKTHTWTFMEKDGLIRIGIDDFLQHITGTITRVIMKEPGETVRRGEKILTLTKFGKQLNLYAPVSGTIKVHNVKLHENASLVNTSPYTDGWVYLVEPKHWLRELQFMLMGEKHREWLNNEFTRLWNFIEVSLKAQHAAFEYAVLQDGGELRDNLLSDLGPEVWEEFQVRFIDPSR